MNSSFAVNTQSLGQCRLCPRDCGVDRSSGCLGYCRVDARIPIASICRHGGEEPVISGNRGICNVFFSHCTMQCRYCQNHQISCNRNEPDYWSIERVVERIEFFLDQEIDMLGFVSPSHVVPQTIRIVEALAERGRHPTIVYNSGGYDKAETLRALEGSVDVYLPDLKYMDAVLAGMASDACDYPSAAKASLGEMYRQMEGPRLHVDDKGLARRGLIVRHLVLPGHARNTFDCLDWITRNLSNEVHISLMSQYYPTPLVDNLPPFNRTIGEEEYESACCHLHELGFENGWVQDIASSAGYRPDFGQEDPF